MLILKEFDKSFYNKQSVITVGTFDGVHLGHRKILEDLNKIKADKNLRSVVVTFDPHPQIILRNRHSKEIKILSTTEEKIKAFEAHGIDVVYFVNFTQEFSQISAKSFYKDYLIDKIGLTDIVLGFDHNFGKNREGNYQTLKELSEKYGFDVHRVDEFMINGEHINSTSIRNLLYKGEVEKASFILGDYYCFEGKVVYGDKRGRQLGFPTANLESISEYKLIPENGVYLVSAEIENDKYYGMMNIGSRPTVSDSNEIFIEVNIFDFSKDIYDKIIKINFIGFIRNEKKFGSTEELIQQINNDKKECLLKINKLKN
jgi:riboflavin kinase / FMN adenylyltransferase